MVSLTISRARVDRMLIVYAMTDGVILDNFKTHIEEAINTRYSNRDRRQSSSNLDIQNINSTCKLRCRK